MSVTRAIWPAGMLAFMLVALLAVVAPRAEAATTCKVANALEDDSVRYQYCIAPAADWPNYKGTVGYVDHHCGFYPFSMGFCTMEHRLLTAWRYVGGSLVWHKSNMGEGTNLYVHPYNKTWRWVCQWDRFTRECGPWHAMQAKYLKLYWRSRV